jgi:hypothetical protein
MTNNRLTALALLVLTAITICTVAVAQRKPEQGRQVDAKELDQLAATPSLEQAILKAAAEKLRQERRPMSTVEIPVTIKVSAGPPGCHNMCVWQGGKPIACPVYCQSPVSPD